MARLINTAGDRQDTDDEGQIGSLLRRGYDFEDAKVTVKTIVGEDETAELHDLPAQDAKQYILGNRVSYMSPSSLLEWKDEQKYSSGYEAAAAGLGAANALSFGLTSEIAKRSGFPQVEKIEKYNPGYSLVADLLTTGGAMMLAGPAAPAIAAKKAPGLLARMGMTSIGKAVKSAPWKYTAPGAIQLLGKKAEKKIAQKILGEASEEVLEKTVKRGLATRMATMGAEGALFAGGYGLVDAAGELYDGRKPAEVVDTFVSEVGKGMLIGAALPAVFHLPGVAAGKFFRGVSAVANKGINVAADTKVAQEFLDEIVEGIALSDPERYATAQSKASLREQLALNTNVDDALEAFSSLVGRRDEIIEQVGRQLEDTMDVEVAIRQLDQMGHTKKFIRQAVEDIEKGTEGAASPIVLIDMLLNGTRNIGKQTGIQGGLINTLEDQTKHILEEGTKYVQAAGARGKLDPLRPQGTEELVLILKEIGELRSLAQGHLDSIVGKVRGKKFGGDHIDWRTLQYDDLGVDATRWQKLSSHLMSMPERRANLTKSDARFIAEVYTRLEKLSSRLNRGIKKGPFKDIDDMQGYMDNLKTNITSFLTNSSDGGWNVPRSIRRGEVQLTPFGRMAEYKSELNTLMLDRDTQQKLIRDKFFHPDPQKPGTETAPNFAEIEKFIKDMDHKTSKYNMEMFGSLADNQLELLERLLGRYNLPKGITKKRLHKVIDATVKQKAAVAKGIDDLTVKMKPALEYYATLERERIAGLSGANPSLLPYAFGTGIGAMFGGVTGAGMGLAGGAAFRFSQEMILNPQRAMAKMHTFFRTVNAYNAFVNKQVDRYFKWLNFAKPTGAPGVAAGVAAEGVPGFVGPKRAGIGPQSKRLSWSEDSHEMIKYPRLWTSNAIARLVTGGEYEGEANKKPGESYGANELEVTKVISDKLSKDPATKQKIIDAVKVQWEPVDPALADALGKATESHINEVAELVKDIKLADSSPFGNPHKFQTNDVQAAEIGRKIMTQNRGTPIIVRGLYDGTLTQSEVDQWKKSYPEESFKFMQTVLSWISDPINRINIPDTDLNMLKMIVGPKPYEQELVMVLQKSFESKEKPGPEPRKEMKNLKGAETAIQKLEQRMG